MNKRAIPFLLIASLIFSATGCGPKGTPNPTATPVSPASTPIPPTPTMDSPIEPTPMSPVPTPAESPLAMPDAPASASERIVMIIAHQDFADQEYSEPRQVFEAAGYEVVVASSSLETATGRAITAQPDILVSDVQVSDYGAIVFIGGEGCMEYWDSPEAHAIAQNAVSENKVLAAICAAPVILANAGVLEGKAATVYYAQGWTEGIDALEAGGAIYNEATVAQDGLIITGNGPAASTLFAETIVTALSAQYP